MRHGMLFLALAGAWGLVLAGGGFFPADADGHGDLTGPCQRAILAHDGQRESLFLAMDYLGNAASFTWLIPCPVEPKITPADPALFAEAARLFTRQRAKAGEREQTGKAGGGKALTDDGVMVLKRLTAGQYDVSEAVFKVSIDDQWGMMTLYGTSAIPQ